MKNNVIPVIIMALGLCTAILFCCGLVVEAFACGVVALIVAIGGLK